MNIFPDNRTTVGVLNELAGDNVHGITFIESSDKWRFVTYAEFIEKIQFCRYNMRLSGIGVSDELVIQTEDSYSFLIVFWAAMMNRVVPVPLAVGKQAGPRKKVLQVWQQLSRPWVAVDGESGRNLEQYGADNVPVIEQIRERAVAIEYLVTPRQRYEDDPMIESNDIAYIQYSSGSTGLPKGVVLTHANLYANVSAILKRSRTTDSDCMLSWMPLTHDMGMICFHLSGVFSGVDQYIMPTGLFIRRPLLWMQVAAAKRATLLYSPNFGLQFFLSALKKSVGVQWDLSAVRLLFNGAEQISPGLCQEFVKALSPFGLKERVMYPGYGLAEASVAVSLPDPMDELRTHTVERATLKSGFPVLFSVGDGNASRYTEVGYPVPDCEVRIVHDGRALPENWLGSIEIRGKNVTKGYYGMVEGSTDLFSPDGWLRTGDQGFLIGGRLVITGRTKNLIIINGQNFFPHDLEELLVSLPGIESGKVVVSSLWSDQLQREELLVFVNYNDDSEAFPEVKYNVARRLAATVGLAVDRVIPVKKIPKTTSGKIQHYLLIEGYMAGEYDQVLQPITKPINI